MIIRGVVSDVFSGYLLILGNLQHFQLNSILVMKSQTILLVRNLHYYSQQKLTDLRIIEDVNMDRQQLLQHIVEAMEVCKEGGIFSSMKSYDLWVDVNEVL